MTGLGTQNSFKHNTSAVSITNNNQLNKAKQTQYRLLITIQVFMVYGGLDETLLFLLIKIDLITNNNYLTRP